jgi:hypothetical protein
MIAKRLQTILGAELNVGEAEMVQRFQKLRDERMLPVSRGRNAEDITPEATLSGLLSIVAERAPFTAQVVRMLKGLRPVGGSTNAFVGADTFGSALLAILSDQATLDTVTEIRLSDSEVYRNAQGRAAIFYTQDDEELVTYYVSATAVSQLQPGMENQHDPRLLIRSIIREIVIYPQVLHKIMRQIRDDEQHRGLMGNPEAE